MASIITVKIDVKKLDKARFFEGKPDRNGHKPLYCDLVLIARKEVGQYGDTHIVKQSVTKEEREARLEMPIIGNATERGGAMNSQGPQQTRPKPAPQRQENLDEDVPF